MRYVTWSWLKKCGPNLLTSSMNIWFLFKTTIEETKLKICYGLLRILLLSSSLFMEEDLHSCSSCMTYRPFHTDSRWRTIKTNHVIFVLFSKSGSPPSLVVLVSLYSLISSIWWLKSRLVVGYALFLKNV